MSKSAFVDLLLSLDLSHYDQKTLKYYQKEVIARRSITDELEEDPALATNNISMIKRAETLSLPELEANERVQSVKEITESATLEEVPDEEEITLRKVTTPTEKVIEKALEIKVAEKQEEVAPPEEDPEVKQETKGKAEKEELQEPILSIGNIKPKAKKRPSRTV